MLRDLLKLSAKAALIVALLGILGADATNRWGPPGGLHALFWAALVAMAAAAVSFTPIVMWKHRPGKELLIAWLTATIVRFVATAALTAYVYAALMPHLTVFLLWLTVFYIALLTWETITFLRIAEHRTETSS